MGGRVADAMGWDLGVRVVEESLSNLSGIAGLVRAEVGPRENMGGPWA